MWRASILALSVGALAFGLVAPASAHVVPTPAYVTANEVDTITLDVPNERARSMSMLVVTAPAGLEIVHAHGPAPPWQAVVRGSTARWTGSRLAPGASASFGLVLDAKTQPGTVQLQAEQRYADGSVVRWPVSLTVLPTKNDSSQTVQLVAVIGLIGVLVIAALGVLVWRRKAGSLQER